MPILRVSMWAGRTKEQKADMARALTETMVEVAGVPSEAVIIQFEDLPKENWATGDRLLGRKTMTMTLRYAHLSERYKNKAANRLNGLTWSVKSGISQNVTF